MGSHDFTYVKIKQKYFRLLEMYPITSKEYPFEAYTGISKLTTTKVCVINIDTQALLDSPWNLRFQISCKELLEVLPVLLTMNHECSHVCCGMWVVGC